MVDTEAIAYSLAALTCALFVLEKGADIFIDHTAIVGNGYTQICHCLTNRWSRMGGMVVVISLSRGQSSLAIGNVVGSAIANILGAFSLGLLFYKSPSGVAPSYSRSSTIYTLLLLTTTSVVSGVLAFGNHINWKFAGITLIVLFGVYIASISYSIARGISAAPEEDSDSDTDSDSDSDDEDSEARRHPAQPSTTPTPTERTRLVGGTPSVSSSSSSTDRNHRKTHSTAYHTAMLFLGFIAVALSGYVITNAATTLIDQFQMSEALFGVIILSIITTIPEKFVAVLSGHKGQLDIMVANTIGSNIFLLTLCLGLFGLQAKENIMVIISDLGRSRSCLGRQLRSRGRFCYRAGSVV